MKQPHFHLEILLFQGKQSVEGLQKPHFVDGASKR